MNLEEVRVCLALAVAQYPSMTSFAHAYNINRGNLSAVLSGRRGPQWEHLAILGLRRVTIYEHARAPK
jgi:hypothetical protein